MSIAGKRIAALRAELARAGVQAYLVPSTDPHQSEYVPACWQRRQWVSGFSGSAGDLVVTRTAAGLWTDGRYWLQATAELKGSGIKLFRQGKRGVPTVADWLGTTLQRGEALGVDPRLLSRGLEAELRTALDPHGSRLRLIEENLVDRIWHDRPAPSQAPVEVLPLEFAGEAVAAKLKHVRRAMAERRAEAHVLSALDAIAWLYNIRSEDVAHNPVVIGYAIVTASQATLYTDLAKLGGRRRLHGRAVDVRPYAEVGAALAALAKRRARVWVDGRTVNAWVLGKLGRCAVLLEPSPVGLLKAKKNATEIAGMIAAHRRDGRALVRFLAWLQRVVPRGGVTEVGAADRLAELRAEEEHFRGESFPTIAAYGAHGAIIHYSPTAASDVELAPRGLFLIDSGGQYLDGTTDVTRTVLLGGAASAEQRDRFTRVLQGHIAIARCRFPVGTAGRQIDALARLALWEVGLDYAHGTGHGVGAYLSVHEGPQAISPTRCTGVPLEAGNILSDEPGFYKEGEYGIRIENLVLTRSAAELSPDGAPFLCFEPLTLVPIDLALVEPALLSPAERDWLDAYHRRVHDELAPRLAAEEQAWLRAATRPLG